MPGAVTIEIKGLPQLLRELQRLSEAAQGRVARNMAMAAARTVARHARALAPVRTGALKKSIKVRRGKARLAKGQAIAFANAADWKAHLLEYGTVFAAPRAYLRPALDSNQPEVRAKMLEIGLNGLQREIRRQQVAAAQTHRAKLADAPGSGRDAAPDVEPRPRQQEQ
jgi:HK97 gp10 family phage protein